MTRRAVLLFGHGSRDPAWRQPMDDVARRIALRAPATPVACAFLELQQPDFAQAIHDLAGQDVDRVTVLPMFLGAGKHVREDLPRLVNDARARHPGLAIEVLPSVGEQDTVLAAIAELVSLAS